MALEGPLFTPGKDAVPIVQEAGWVPVPVWTGAENLAPPGFDPRTVQYRSQSLYRLIVAERQWKKKTKNKTIYYN